MLALLSTLTLTLAYAKSTAPPDWAIRDQRLNLAISAPPPLTEVIVAIIDTGIDSHHPNLIEPLWTNKAEIPDNGIDDDHNGFIDDVHGWDFVKSIPKLSDHHGHGTHIAGIIHQGAPAARLMILKYYDPGLAPEQTVANTVAAIRYATKMGAQIINYSAGGNSFSEPEFEALREAGEKGVLVVAAAGNDGTDSSLHPYFPATYPLSNILSVTAYGPTRRILPSSNYGNLTVDLSAPGEDIQSTLPGGRFGLMTGTSQATAFATAAAALTRARYPWLNTPLAIKQHLFITASKELAQLNKTKTGSRLDSLQALRVAPEDKNPLTVQRRSVDRGPSSPPANAYELAAQLEKVLSRPEERPKIRKN